MDENRKKTQYNYQDNSNIVSFSDTRRLIKEPTGEGETLKGKKLSSMGDKAKPYNQKVSKSLISTKKDSNVVKKSESLMKNNINFEVYSNLLYKPKTKESISIYKELLKLISQLFSDESSETIMKILDEILAVLLLDNTVSNQDKYINLVSIIGNIDRYTYDKIYSLSKNLLDYNSGITEEKTDIALQISDNEKSDSEDTINNINENISDNNLSIDNDKDSVCSEKVEDDTDSSFNIENDKNNISDNHDIYDILENDMIDIDNKDTNIYKNNTQINKKLTNSKIYIRLLNQRLGSTQYNRAFNNSSNNNVLLDTYEKTSNVSDNIITTKHEGYDHYKILPQILKVNNNTIELSIEKTLESWMHKAFQYYDNTSSNYEFVSLNFNRVQSKVLNTALNTEESMLICAPTSSGKTNIAMLSILNLMKNHSKIIESTNNSNNEKTKISFNLQKIKVVIITPMKALAKETVNNFGNRLASYGLKVSELSGDSSLNRYEIEETNIIVATPEKWDIVSRKLDNKSIIDNIKLMIIDEIHLLHDIRGTVIESIVSRTNKKIALGGIKTRIVALSATLPNYYDISEFLNVSKENTFYFDNSYRPIPLENNFIGISEKSTLKKINLQNHICYKIIEERKLINKQVIVFVHSRRETFKLGKYIKEVLDSNKNNEINNLVFSNKINQYQEILKMEMSYIKSTDLKLLLPYGIGIHHAGLTKEDKTLVEDYFNNGYLQTIISTSTLAWGVNLPAHTVVIKGTKVYSPENGGWIEVSIQDILQMIGRAGRVGYIDKQNKDIDINNYGEGFIITGSEEVKYYMSIFSSQLPIESQLIKTLPECINAEVVLKSINSIDEGINWFKYTYLFNRMIKNPELYGISKFDVIDKDKINSIIKDFVFESIKMLENNGLLTYDKKSGFIQSTALGQLTSYYYLKYESITTYNQNLNPHMNIIDIFRIFSLSEEFKLISVREEEKEELEILSNKVPVPLKSSFDESCSKINILLQACISKLSLDGYSIMSDMIYISQNASRIFRALFEITLKKSWSNVAQTCLNVCKMIDRRIWMSNTPLRQFSGIEESIFINIEKKEKLSWDKFVMMSSSEISECILVSNTNKEYNKRAGELIFNLLKRFPKLQLEAFVKPISIDLIEINLEISLNINWHPKIHGKQMCFIIIVEDNDSDIILHYEYIYFNANKKELKTSFMVTVINPLPPQYFIKVVSDKWLHCDAHLPISFKKLVLPDKFPDSTNLLNIDASKDNTDNKVLLPISEILNEKDDNTLVDYFKDKGILTLNLFQSKIFFKAVQNFNMSIMILSPFGSGRGTVILLLVILNLKKRKFSDNNNLPIVYISPIESYLNNMYMEYKNLFKIYNDFFKVGILKENNIKDLECFNSNDLIFSTPENYDNFSRKHHSKTKLINTFILDNIQLINYSNNSYNNYSTNSNYEITLTRIKYSNPTAKLIVIGISISNYDDIYSWLGIDKEVSFNFKLNNKPNKVELYVAGFDQYHKDLRISSMHNNIYSYLDNHLLNKKDYFNSIIITTDKNESKKLALNIVNYYSEKEVARNELNFISLYKNYKDPQLNVINSINDIGLKSLAKYQIGFYHNSMKPIDKQIIIDLYNKNLIKILLISYNSIFEINLKTNLLIIQDTIKYDSLENNYNSYSITEISKISSFASSFTNDNSSVYILCSSSKKEFYKRFLLDAYPVESNLNKNLPEHLNIEISRNIIKNKQLCLDWMSWTFMYRRLFKNPNYYDLFSSEETDISEYLSQIIDSSLNELIKTECCELEENTDNDNIIPLSYSKICNQYNISYKTIEYFSNCISNSIESFKKLSYIVELLSSSEEIRNYNFVEYDSNMYLKLNQLIKHKFPVEDISNNECNFDNSSFNYLNNKICTNPQIKANILIQIYLNRTPYPYEVKNDCASITNIFVKLLSALIDILSNNALLEEVLISASFSQMLVQGNVINKSNLYQLPYFDEKRVNKAKEIGVNDISTFLELDDDKRDILLNGLSESKIEKIANVCNRFPIYDVNYNIYKYDDAKNLIKFEDNTNLKFSLSHNELIVFNIEILRDIPDDEIIDDFVCSNTYAKEKEELWWAILAERKTNRIYCIKKFKLNSKVKKLELKANCIEQGFHKLSIIITSDSWIGCDYEDDEINISIQN